MMENSPLFTTMFLCFPKLRCFTPMGFNSLILLPRMSVGDLSLQTQHGPASAVSPQLYLCSVSAGYR